MDAPTYAFSQHLDHNNRMASSSSWGPTISVQAAAAVAAAAANIPQPSSAGVTDCLGNTAQGISSKDVHINSNQRAVALQQLQAAAAVTPEGPVQDLQKAATAAAAPTGAAVAAAATWQPAECIAASMATPLEQAAAAANDQQQQQQPGDQEEADHDLDQSLDQGCDPDHDHDHDEQQHDDQDHDGQDQDHIFGQDDHEDLQADLTCEDDPTADTAEAEGDAAAAVINNICMVDGCDVDLSGMKPYFRRSKVCPAHQSSAVVLVEGQECRFCQQCTRCHPVTEFDGTKRSCRSQLLHHNKSRKHRRRCTPGSFYSSKRVRSHHGVAKKKAAAGSGSSRSPAAATKAAAAAAAKAAKAAAAAAAKAAAKAIADRIKAGAVQPSWQKESADSPWAAAAGSRAAAMWSPNAAAAAVRSGAAPAAAAAQMPGFDTRMSKRRLQEALHYDYTAAVAAAATAAAAAAAPLRSHMPHHMLAQQYSADSLGPTAFSGPMGSQPMLEGFRSLPNYLNPDSLGGSLTGQGFVTSQGVDSSQGIRPLPNYLLNPSPSVPANPGFSTLNPRAYSSHDLRFGTREPQFEPQGLHNPVNPHLNPHPGTLQNPSPNSQHQLNPGVSATVSRTASMTGGPADQIPVRTEDAGPSCSSCSSKGSPHMPTAAAAAAYNGGRLITTIQQQQQQQLVWQQQQQANWQQQQQQQQQLPIWMSQQDEMHWQQQQQQQLQSMRSNHSAVAPARNLFGSSGNLLAGHEVAVLHQSLQHQQQQPRLAGHLQEMQQRQQQMQPHAVSNSMLGTANSYDSGLEAWPCSHQQQQQHMHSATLEPQQQHLPPQLMGSNNSRLQLARQLAQQAAAAAASAARQEQEQQQQQAMLLAATQQQQQQQQQQQDQEGLIAAAVAAAAAGPGVSAMMGTRHQSMQPMQQQQQYMQGPFMQQQQQQQHDMAMMQQQASPDVSAGSTCAPAGSKRSPHDVYSHPFAAAAAHTPAAAAPVGYTVAPYNFNKQQQDQPQQQHAGYSLAPADVVVGFDVYSRGPANPGWATANAPHGSGPENPGSYPSDDTHTMAFDRVSSMTSHNAGASGAFNTGSNPGNPAPANTIPAGLNSLPANLMGLDVPALAALMGSCLESDAEDAWLLDACHSTDDKDGDPLMATLGDLGF